MPMAMAPATAPGIEPSPPSTAAAKIDSTSRVPVSGSTEVSSPTSMPPIPASPAPTITVTTATRTGSTPRSSARSRLSATARIARPVRLKRRKAQSSAMLASARPKFCNCCGPTRNAPKRQSRSNGSSKPRRSLPKPKRSTFSSTSPAAREAIAIISAPDASSGFTASACTASPARPATPKASGSAPSIGRPSAVLPTQPA